VGIQRAPELVDRHRALWGHMANRFGNLPSGSGQIITKVDLASSPSASGILVLHMRRALDFRSECHRDSYETASLGSSGGSGPNERFGSDATKITAVLLSEHSGCVNGGTHQ
jgi:hypothetical protein